MERGTTRISLREYDPQEYGDGWVDVWAYRTYGERLAVQDAVAEEGRSSALYLKVLEVAITGWSLEGQPGPGAFRNLPEHLAEWLFRRITEHYESQRRPEAEGNGSSGRSSPASSGATAGGPRPRSQRNSAT